MSDMISRSELLKLFPVDMENPLWHFTGIRAAIEAAPTIDAVPVVRCKDCVCVSGLNDDLICSRIRDVMDGYYHGTVDIVKPDDYCSYGKRRVAKCKGAVENG
jgi:hypothetical protein